MGELQLCLDQDYQNAYFSTHHVAPGDGDFARFQPAAGIAMSYDDLKIVEAYRLVQSIATGKAHGATAEDAPMPPRSSRRWPSRHRAVAG